MKMDKGAVLSIYMLGISLNIPDKTKTLQ
jgi:hypothetical protein